MCPQLLIKKPYCISGAYTRAHGGMAVPSNVSAMNEPVFSSSMQYGGPLDRDGGNSTTLADGHKISQVLVIHEYLLLGLS